MKFEIGEIALTTRPSRCGNVAAGVEVLVVAVGPWRPGEFVEIRGFAGILYEGCDYFVWTGRGLIPCDEPFLRKRPERGIPAEVLQIFEKSQRVLS